MDCDRRLPGLALEIPLTSAGQPGMRGWPSRMPAAGARQSKQKGLHQDYVQQVVEQHLPAPAAQVLQNHVSASRGVRSASLPDNLFKPSAANMSVNCKSIKGTTAKTEWFSPTADTSVTPFADLALFHSLEAGAGGDMLGAGTAWKGALVVGDNMLLRRQGTAQWFLPLGHVPGSLVIAVEVKQELAPAPGMLFCYLMPTNIAPVYLAVTKWDDWQAMPVEWLSPLSQMNRWTPALSAPGAHYSVHKIRAVAKSDPMPILDLAAKNAFWTLPTQLLRKIADECGVAEVASRKSMQHCNK